MAYVKPVSKDAKFARVDQGVDYQQDAPYKAIGAGKVVRVAPHSFAGGTGDAVYIQLDKPIVVGGRTYSQVYYAEQTPLVRLGQRVRAGQAVMKGGGAELGFANNNAPAAPLVGGLGSGTQKTQAGMDFLAFVHGSEQAASTPYMAKPTVDTSQALTSTGQNLTGQLSGALGAIPQLDTAPQASAPLAGGQPPDTTLTPQSVGDTWQLIASQGNVSPDTLRLAQLASSAVNGTG